MRFDPGRRPVLVIALAGLACAALVALGGVIAERVRLGIDDEAAFRRVEQEVRSEFQRMTSALGRIATTQAAASRPVLLRPAEERDLRPLFQTANGLVGGDDDVLAVTLYSPAGTPLVWAGRPSELTTGPRASDRFAGPAALFVAPGPLGFRLVRTEPVIGNAGRSQARLGVVAAERLFSDASAVGNTSSERFAIDTSLVPVSLRTRYEGAGDKVRPFSFVIASSSGEPLVEASVDRSALSQLRQGHRRVVWCLVVGVLAVTLLLVIGPVLDWRTAATRRSHYLAATAAAAALVVGGRLLLAFALPPGRLEPLSSAGYHWPALGIFGRHPVDFLLTGLAAFAFVALAAGPAERRRQVSSGPRRVAVAGAWPTLAFFLCQAAGGVSVALAVIGYEAFLGETFRRATVDILQFSPHPWQPARLAVALGLVLFHAAFAWLAVIWLRLLLSPWRFPRRDLRARLLLLVAVALPAGAVWAVCWSGRLYDLPRGEAFAVVLATAAVAYFGPRGLGRFRHASQGYRLIVGFFALLAPAMIIYPSLVFFHEGARRRIVETRYAPEVLDQLDNLKMRLRAAQAEIDGREASLAGYVSVPDPPGGTVGTASAFTVWQGTALERYRVSSAIELYNANATLVSRFALNLPEDATGKPWREESCSWRTFGEISPFGSHERQLLHAGRNVCGPQGVLGTIVIHVIIDYSTLSFISSQSPYMELLRGHATSQSDEARRRDIEFTVYGWSRTPLYVSGTTAWPIDDALFARTYASRVPFWTRLSSAGVDYEVFVENDRPGFYALGYPVISFADHCLNLAELAVLVALEYGALILAAALLRAAGIRRVRAGRDLLREIRESFYRKVFLAFVAASVVPVVTLALVTRVYIAERLRHDVELAAHKTTVIARQMIEDYRVQASGKLGDDAMVGLSRVIGQDVNIFDGAWLEATSERDLFASGLLPVRTPADVYRAIVLDRMPTVIAEEQAAGFHYMIAGAPLRVSERDAILTVPLTLRQQEIEREIDDLNRRIVLAAMLFIVVGAAIGYPMAERIADPVKRLTRATRRIARGDFDARVAATSSDELRRLVEAFNLMSAELLRQRQELERTHRLEAWAEMARQVAHDIKNPLTPIQLSAEHLRRVHNDRGKPLDPVLDGCVDSILSQVRLLRQIATEFSSFASSPTARVAPVDLYDLVEEVFRPYEAGGQRWTFLRELAAGLPLLLVDRALIGRALTNVIDNALHAMPGGGTLTVRAILAQHGVELQIADTGVGMDEEALGRLFEPYFSTKAVGTGLGLSIARRNVELNGGTIAVTSEKGRGTVVTLQLPTAGPAA